MSGLDAGNSRLTGTSSEEMPIEEPTPLSADDSVKSSEPETESMNPETYFLELGVLEPCEDEDDLRLADEFTENWSGQTNRFDEEDTSAEQVVDAFDFDTAEDEYNIETHDDARVLYHDSGVIGQWPSQAALMTDLGAAAVLEMTDPQWNEYVPSKKANC